MHNKMIGKCSWCDQDYCQECSDHPHWEQYCSEQCFKEMMEEYKRNHPTKQAVTDEPAK